jgi:hypothetical protein
MTDIVEWLRAEAELVALDRLEEAAGEIERLRTKCELWKARAYAEGFVPAGERKP